MNLFFRSAFLIILFLIHFPAGAAVSGGEAYRSGEVLIQLKAGAGPQDRARLDALLGRSEPLAFRSDILWMKLSARFTVPQALALLKGDSAVLAAQPNYIYQLFQSCAVPTNASDAYFTSAVVPNPACSAETGNGNVNWPYLLVNAPTAWSLMGSQLTCPAVKPVTVAVIDTGVASDYTQARHPDLPSSLFIPGYNSSGDWGGDTTDTVDNHGHGTMVTGILAAQWNNSGGTNVCLTGAVPAGNFNGGAVGIAGYPGAVKIMPVKVAVSTGGSTSGTIIEGVYYAALHHAQVLNISLGSAIYDPLVLESVTYAINQGCVVVAAVGNSGNAFPLSYPAGYPGVLAVGAVGPGDVIASYSQTGTGMGMVAPGGAALSLANVFDTADNFFGCFLNCPSPLTDPAFQVDPCDNNYGVASGTSMATPMVSGAAAILLALNPSLANNQVVQILESTAHQIIGSQGTYNTVSGWGRLDFNAALVAGLALGTQPAWTVTPTPQPYTPTPTPGLCGAALPGAVWTNESAYDFQSVGGAVFDAGDGNGPRPFLLGGGAATNPVTIFHWIPSANSWAAFGSTQAPLLNRRRFNVVAFNNYLWVLGGLLNGTTYENDSWFSFDGFHYNLGTSNAGFAGRSDFASLVFQNDLWVIGGQTASGLTNDAWFSPDGVSWTQATTPPFSAREGLAAVVFNNRLWVLGGQTAAGFSNEIWSTGDGTNWSLSSPSSPSAVFSPRAYHLAVVCGNSIWVMGGNTASGPVSDVWNSQDGSNWTQTIVQTSFGPVSQYSQVALAYEGQVWSSGALGFYTSNCCDVPTPTPTATATSTWTPSPTVTPSPSPTLTPTVTVSPTPTNSPTMTISPTSTATFSITPTLTPTITPSVTPTITPDCSIHVWPNPYSSRLAVGHTMKFSCLPTGSSISLFTVSGELVQKLPQAGDPTEWNGLNASGQPVGPGIYFYVIQAGSRILDRNKFLIVK